MGKLSHKKHSIAKAKLTHLGRRGEARMVDVGSKAETLREAVAGGEVVMSPRVIRLLRSGRIGKGDVLAVARVAGILAAKRTGDLLPLCHPLLLDVSEVSFRLMKDRVQIRSRVRTHGKTGVEMEALTAVAVAALTIYDMCKSADRAMTIGSIFLARKSGGRSGLFKRPGIEGEWLEDGTPQGVKGAIWR